MTENITKLCLKKVYRELKNNLHRNIFVSAAQRCERDNVRLEKDLQIDHFKAAHQKEQLRQKDIYLSSMQKRKKCTDQCNLYRFDKVNCLFPYSLLFLCTYFVKLLK